MSAFHFYRHLSMTLSLLVLLAFFLKQSSCFTEVLTPYTSSYSTDLVYFVNLYWIFYRGDDGKLMFGNSVDGTTWTSSHQILSTYTSDGPGVVKDIGGTLLHLFARDPNGNGIFHLVYNGVTNMWSSPPSGPYWIGTDLDNAPAAAVIPVGETYAGRICVVGSDAGGSAVMYNTMDSNGNVISTGNTGYDQGEPPGIVYYSHSFHVFFKAGNGLGMMHISSSDGVSWGDLYQLGNVNGGWPSALAYSNSIYLFYISSDNAGICIDGDCGQSHVWATTTTNSWAWNQWNLIPRVSAYTDTVSARVSSAVVPSGYMVSYYRNSGTTISIIQGH